MSVLILLIAVSLALSAGFVGVCVASIRSGQFDDLESPRWRMLFAETAGDAPPAFIPPGFSSPGITSQDLTPNLGPTAEPQSRIARHDPH